MGLNELYAHLINYELQIEKMKVVSRSVHLRTMWCVKTIVVEAAVSSRSKVAVKVAPLEEGSTTMVDHAQHARFVAKLGMMLCGVIIDSITHTTMRIKIDQPLLLLPPPTRLIRIDHTGAAPTEIQGVSKEGSNRVHPMQTRLRNNIRQSKEYIDGRVRYSLHRRAFLTKPMSHVEALEDSNWKQATDDEIAALHKNSTWKLVPNSRGQDTLDCTPHAASQIGPAAPIGPLPRVVASGADPAPAVPALDAVPVHGPVPVRADSQSMASPPSSAAPRPARVDTRAASPDGSSVHATLRAAGSAAAPHPVLPKGAVPIAPVSNDHTMVTRGKASYQHPVKIFNLHAALISPLPKSYRGALADPNWRAAMDEEFSALKANNTWDLIPCPSSANIVTSKWVFRHKLHPNGSLDRYKARWVLRGFTQRPGIDFGETFSPVVKPATIRTVLTIAHSQEWSIHQLDVKNAFPHGTLTETVYCVQPSGFVDFAHPDYVCRLNKSLYGLKQAPRAWFNRLFLSQRQYILDVIERAGMSNSKPYSTPVDTSSKVSCSDGAPVSDATHYRGLAGALQYLTFTRLDITYAVQQGAFDFGLVLHRTAISSLVAYSDVDWAGCPDTRRSTSGYGVFIGDNLISWSSKRQHTVSRSSAEAEYRAVANAVAETSWLRQLLLELHCPLQHATLVYCDNHQHTKHVELDLHFVRERVAVGAVRVLHVPTTSQYVDIFTKGLPSFVFAEFRLSLSDENDNLEMHAKGQYEDQYGSKTSGSTDVLLEVLPHSGMTGMVVRYYRNPIVPKISWRCYRNGSGTLFLIRAVDASALAVTVHFGTVRWYRPLYGSTTTFAGKLGGFPPTVVFTCGGYKYPSTCSRIE
uniref:Putative retrotransposon protein n=1 Tax=Phyllostachys edulis TaxID=38705 RepID=D3IVP3_PHYED|nr:putative retrotransposon protein [Phyllostachys edulis]